MPDEAGVAVERKRLGWVLMHQPVEHVGATVVRREADEGLVVGEREVEGTLWRRPHDLKVRTANHREGCDPEHGHLQRQGEAVGGILVAHTRARIVLDA